MSFLEEGFVAVPVSVGLYRQLVERHPHPHLVIEDVVADFLERTARAVPVTSKKRIAGLHWESAFLPEKTRIRTKHHGEYKYADVKGDYVVFEGEQFSSVGSAINAMRGGTSNNAWKVSQVMRPGDSAWLGALRIRRQSSL
jgi:hypothetical protein